MAIDTSVPRTRRALLAGGLGGMAALVASAIGRPLPTDATDGDTVHVGQYHTGANSTMFDTGSTGAAAIVGQSSAGTGVYGSSSSWRGVYGYSDSDFGVYGYSDSNVAVAGTSWATAKPAIVGLAEGDNTGVLGWSGATSVVPVTPPRTGVYGYAAQDTSSVGVGGETTAGTGVRGETESGTGVAGLCDTGIGVLGHGQTGIGVSGSSSYDIGIDGWSGATTKAAIVGASAGNSTGVHGHSGSIAGASPAKTGVYGYAAQDAASRGVTGRSSAGYGVNGIATAGRGVNGEATTGYGVRGRATTGTAGYFSTTNVMQGYALRAVGRVKLDKCAGVATVASGAKSVVVTPGIDLVSTSAVVATMQGNPAGTTTVRSVAVNTVANTFTIHLTATATAAVKVAWIVLG